jgi:hypothetical protein
MADSTQAQLTSRILPEFRVFFPYCPVPVSKMLCGEPVAVSVIVTAAVSEPAVVGVICP